MVDPEVIEDKSGYIPKAKKPMSEAQLASLAKARQKAYEIRQQKKNVVNIDSSSEEDEDKDTQPKPEPEKPKAKPRQRKTKPKPPVQKEEPTKEDDGEASDEIPLRGVRGSILDTKNRRSQKTEGLNQSQISGSSASRAAPARPRAH